MQMRILISANHRTCYINFSKTHKNGGKNYGSDHLKINMENTASKSTARRQIFAQNDGNTKMEISQKLVDAAKPSFQEIFHRIQTSFQHRSVFSENLRSRYFHIQSQGVCENRKLCLLACIQNKLMVGIETVQITP